MNKIALKLNVCSVSRGAALLGASGLAIAYVAGCGGGGGSSVNRGAIPPAPPPTCNQSVSAPTRQLALVGGGQASIRVPASSVPRSSDAGVRAHTNHLVLMRSALTRLPGPSGLTPAQVLKAYGVPANGGAGAIAVVDAFNYPTALADFNTFSSQFNLPTESSADATDATNTTFQVIYAGGTKPADDPDWSQEMAVDTQWAHSMAPKAKIYLVEAASASLSDLMTAVGVAKRLAGVHEVGLSWGSTEDACSFVKYDSAFSQAGVAFYGAAGDTSDECDFPAMSVNVVAVGGTTLNVAPDGTWLSETVWNSTGGGISAFEPRPIFQDVIENLTQRNNLGYRADADIAAIADPNTGVSAYDSFPAAGSSGWQVFGGTSTGTPIIAAIANVAAAGRLSSQEQNTAFYAGIGGPNFHDITQGSSGTLSAAAGWDPPTGVGSPKGIGGF